MILCFSDDEVFGDRNVAVLTPFFFIINGEANRVKTISVYALVYSRCLYTCFSMSCF
jgi:hypothetical protein